METKPIVQCLIVGFGGAFGSVGRYGTGLLAARLLGNRFPYGTLVANVSGCFLIGLTMTILLHRTPGVLSNDTLRLALVTGFLGGYTTFSSYAYESEVLFRNGLGLAAAINLLGTIIAGLIAVRVGMYVAATFAGVTLTS